MQRSPGALPTALVVEFARDAPGIRIEFEDAGEPEASSIARMRRK